MQQAAQELALSMRDGCLGVRISRLHRLVARRYDQALRPLGLTLPQLEVLAVLTLLGPSKPAAVADALAVERSTISRTLAAMQARGWVQVEASPAGRTVSVAVTDDGRDALASARRAWTEAQAAVSDLLPGASCATFDAWVEALASA